MRDADASPFVHQTGYYDRVLLQSILNCSPKGLLPWDALFACVQRHTSTLPLDGKTLERVLDQAPSPRDESGVRDRPYTLERDLVWFQPPSGDTHAVRFMRTYMFDQTSSAEEEKTQPWEPVRIAQQTDASVRRMASISPNIGQLLRDADEFAVLQRFFRLALDGTLGSSFPRGSLRQLSKELSAVPVEKVRLPRWTINYSPQSLRDEAVGLLTRLEREPMASGTQGAGTAGFPGAAARCRQALAAASSSVPAACRFEDGDEQLARACSGKTGDSRLCEMMERSREATALIARSVLMTRVRADEPPNLPRDSNGIAVCPAIK
jgi:hypothetical protein